MDSRRERFRELHRAGFFLLANAWDVGSARLLETMGFVALATTSAGHAATLGRMDQQVSRDELVEHVAALCAATSLPLNVDAERCFAERPADIAETIDLLAEAGAAGISIEDYDPATGGIDELPLATDRVAAAVEACARHGVVLTARAENHIRGVDDLDDSIERLQAFRSAGAEVVYAPGLKVLDQIGTVVNAVDAPLNVLAWRGGPTATELAGVGVRRMSVGGSLAFVAYGAMAKAAQEWQEDGTIGFLQHTLAADLRAAAFGPAPR